MTREQKKQRRRSRLCWIAAAALIAIWTAIFLTICAHAADAAEAAQPLDPLTKTLAIIGAFWASRAMMRVVAWIDGTKGKQK